MQKYVEVDEPEAEAVPMLSTDTRMPVLGQDDQSTDTAIAQSSGRPPGRSANPSSSEGRYSSE